MASRNYAQVAPTAATMALNAYIYGYGGHSLVTPHAALKRLWWTDERIDAKITRPFVVSKLRGEEREFLDKPLAFGEGLTDDTYMEWILERAKRLFLILAEIGVPDQIFGCIDDTWDDEDLPISLDDVRSLELSYENDEALNKKFYDKQFVYLLRELKTGAHIDYGPNEHIPMEHVNTMPPAVHLQPYDRVHFPNKPDDVYMRRKFSLTDRETGQYYGENFMRDMKKAKAFPHEHIAPVFATYTSKDAGFVLSDFVPEHTLGTFIEHRTPTQFQRVSLTERPILLIEWMHCLSDALASLHHRGLAHGHIRPSNIWIDKNNKIAFADIGTIPTFQRNKKFPKTEAYDYAAPEQQIARAPVIFKSMSPPVSSLNAFSRLRKLSSTSSSDSSSLTSGSSGTSSVRSSSVCQVSTPLTAASMNGRSSISTIRTDVASAAPTSNRPASPTSTRNFSRHIGSPISSPVNGPGSPTSITSGTTHLLMSIPSSIDPDTLRDLPASTPSMSDVYSLACIYLDILTLIIKGKTTEFIKFRSSRITTSSSASSTYSSKPSSGSKSRTDSSFHSSPDKILSWIDTLEEDSYRHAQPIFRGIPLLLSLVRTMLSQNATLRPTALQVRDKIAEILFIECGVEEICCEGREWAEAPPGGDDSGSSNYRSPFRRQRTSSVGNAGDAPASGARCSTSYGESSSGSANNKTKLRESDAERMSIRSAAPASASVPAGAVAAETSSNGARKGRRGSSSSSATAAKMGSWRKRFLRH